MMAEIFLDNPKKVSLETLVAIFEYISSHVSNYHSTLSAVYSIMHAYNKLLSSIFQVHASTVSRYFQKWIDVMHEKAEASCEVA